MADGESPRRQAERNYDGRINVLRATVVIWIAILILPAATLGLRSVSTDRASAARAYYKRCPNLRYKGRHKLFRHALACSVARGKAIYVLKHRQHPPGWHCSLGNLADGYGACTRRARAFEFLPL